MVFSFQTPDVGIHEHYSRRDRVRRALTAFMAYQSGYLTQHGISIPVINSRVDETEEQFFSDIPEPRRVALRPRGKNQNLLNALKRTTVKILNQRLKKRPWKK